MVHHGSRLKLADLAGADARADTRQRLNPATSGQSGPAALGRSVPFAGRCGRRSGLALTGKARSTLPSTDAIGSMKAPVRVALMDFRGCRRGALRSGEQRLAFDAGEELGGSDFEFE
jgi:hypothetical protein